jgi:hypothetical protein
MLVGVVAWTLTPDHWYHLIAICAQLPDPEIKSPNSCQVVPSNFCNCICLIGVKSLALVEMMMPGSSIGSWRSRMLVACLIRFSRVRLSPHAFSTATIVCAAEYP